MAVQFSNTDLQNIVSILSASESYSTAEKRYGLLNNAFGAEDLKKDYLRIVPQIDNEGSPISVATHTLIILKRLGTMANGEEAVFRYFDAFCSQEPELEPELEDIVDRYRQ